MKKLSTHWCRLLYSNCLTWVTVVVFSMLHTQNVLAQATTAACNTSTSVTNPAFTNLTVVSSTGGLGGDEFDNKGNLIDNDPNSAATFSTVAGSAWLELRDNNATGTELYAEGTYAGFVISTGSIAANTTITLYNGATQVTTRSYSGLANLNLGGGRIKVGVIATAPFNRVRITWGGVTGSISVYYPLIERFCDTGPELACNTITTVTSPSYPVYVNPDNTGFGGLLNIGTISNEDNAVSTSSSDYATINITAGVGSVANFSIKRGAGKFPNGSFAGMDIESTGLLSLAALSNVTIATYNGGSLVQSVSGSSLITANTAILGTTGRRVVGFITNGQPYDEIRLSITKVADLSLSLSETRVYGAVVQRFCSNTTPLACNTATTITTPTYPVYINPANTGFGGLLNIGTIKDENNAVSASSSDYATINITAGVGSVANFSVKNVLDKFPGNSFAGMDVESTGLLSVAALQSLTITTYNSGTLVQSQSGGSLVSVNTGILNGSGRRVVGFITNGQPYDEIQLRIAKVADVSLSLSETRIYGAVVQSFCAGPNIACGTTDANLPINTLTPMTNPTFPVYVNGTNTGIGTGVACVGCSINNSQRIVDSDLTNYATIDLGVTVGASASIAVANALETYPTGTYAGFDVQTASILSANVLGSATVTLYNNGSVVQTGTGNALIVGATTPLLGSNVNRQYIGLVANQDFDEVKIVFNQTGAGLGVIRIYNAIVQKNCQATIACNTAYSLNTPSFPVVINYLNTGSSGAVAASVESSPTVENPWNVVSASTTDFARIRNTATVAADASISVLNAVGTFPVGTFAGFAVKKVSGVVELDLLSRLRVTTYLDGVQQETRSAGGLLNLSIILFGQASDFANVGFITSLPFDEIKLSVAPLVGLDVLGGYLDVYGAFIDTRSSSGGGLACAINTNPDFAVTNKNVPVAGNVSTNDFVPAGTTYGPTPALISGPAGATPTWTLTSSGSFTFTSGTPGVYVYTVPVCTSATNCVSQTLTITVLDPTVNTNNPVANPDIVSMTGAPTATTAVTINVRANDGPGNPDGTLGNPTIAQGPSNGTASIVGGNVQYTPNAGFYGTDVLTYQVCETPNSGSPLCSTATVTITVKAPNSANTTMVADDYVSTLQGLAVSGNVSTNDSDPEGNTQTVTAQNTTIPGKGTFVLTSTGSFTFTPTAGSTGPVDFTYTVSDNGSPSVSASGTLHVLVNPFNPNPDFSVSNVGVPTTGSVKTNDIVPVGTTYGPTATLVSQPSGSSPTLTLTSTGSYTFTSATPGVYVYSVPVCATATYCVSQSLTITVLDPNVTTNKPVVNPDFALIVGSPTAPAPVSINVKANDGPGNVGGTLGDPTIAQGPSNGTASIVGGNVQYTPNAGFYGVDVLTYQVCEPGSSTNCATAAVTITVQAPGGPTVVSINDDYVSTSGGIPATGNVLNNDLGNNLNVSNTGTTTTSSGTLVITNTGSFTFTPAPGVTGPVAFTYTACDAAGTCGSATLHVLVNQGFPDLTPSQFVSSAQIPEGGSIDLLVSIRNVSATATNGVVRFYITNYAPSTGLTMVVNTDPSVTIGGTAFPLNTSDFTISSNNFAFTLETVAGPSGIIPGNGRKFIAFKISRAASSTKGDVTNTVTIEDGTGGGEAPVNNNTISNRIFKP